MIGDLFKKDIEDSLLIHGEAWNGEGIQTQAILFENTTDHWEKIKTSFIESCERKPVAVRAWAYIERPGINTYPRWHTHGENRDYGHCFQCGVMYLDRFKHGTMFKFGNMEIIGDPTPFVWHMFSPNTIHRPPDWDIHSTETRYVISVEAFDSIDESLI